MNEEKTWVQVEIEEANYGRFVASPLKRGFGNTIGNSLRRVLLASLEGASMVAVKVNGVQHEFTCLKDMKEDVLELIMNLKNVIYKINSNDDEVRTVKLSVSKEGEVTAGNIKLPSDVEVINKKHYLTTLNKGGKLEVDITIKKGIGFVPLEIQDIKDMPVGTIPIDATFSPVLKVNYTVEDFRVGKKIDFDKLTLEIWTDGSILPMQALIKSANILREELGAFININEEPRELVEQKKEASSKESKELNLTIEDLELSARSYNCLRKANVEKVADLVKKDLKDLMKIKNFGKKSADEINDKLKQYNLSLKNSEEMEEE